MKTALLWIFLCLFFGVSAFEFALLVAIVKRADIEERLTKVERRQQYYASGSFNNSEGLTKGGKAKEGQGGKR